MGSNTCLPTDVKDMSPMILTAEGPDEIFDDYKVVLKVSSSDANRLRIYQKKSTMARIPPPHLSQVSLQTPLSPLHPGYFSPSGGLRVGDILGSFL